MKGSHRQSSMQLKHPNYDHATIKCMCACVRANMCVRLSMCFCVQVFYTRECACLANNIQ